ncbi:16S rRNA (cytosine(967)-C(5))-methyltransferase RsmB [candidate division KSB1 bacterium]|nr:16S rRNA (cytosine(967)-C(5))-methyltransferase RsmB [candidate division KSB1 bacterium]
MTHTTTAPVNSRAISVDALLEFESGVEYADELLSRHLTSSQLRGSDRALAADLFWGVIRWRGRLDGVVTPVFHGDYQKANPLIRVLLRLGAYQLYVQERIPDHAAVSQTVEIAVQRLGKSAAGLINAILRRLARERERWNILEADTDDIGKLAFFHSHPRWIVKQLVDQFGEEAAEQALERNNTRAPLTVRVNLQRASIEDVLARMRERGITAEVSPLLPHYLRLHQTPLHLIQPLLDRGLVNVQDESGGLVVELLSPEPGDHILDACAAPGGKTLAIADRMAGTGRILATDVAIDRLELLKENIVRTGLTNVEFRAQDAREMSGVYFDKVLTDVPCSALGLLRRQPDVRWRRRSHHLPAQHRLQLEILSKAAETVKPGGVLVYSTCSILPSENHEIVNQFLHQFPEFHKEDARGFVPEAVVNEHGDMATFSHLHDTDGAYAARMRRSAH